MVKVNIKICMGTMCYVMGGAELLSLVEALPEDVSRNVAVSYSPCLGVCGGRGEPPYVELNGKILGGVSKTTLLRIIKEALNDVV